MAAISVLAIEQGWEGDRKRHLVAALVANNSTATPAQFGLKKVEAIIPSAIIAGDVSVNGVAVTLTNHGTHVITWASATITFAVQTTANSLWYVYGW